jgi:hypothetical protein
MTVATEEEREQRVTVLELFFDLVFVFAFTQVATLLSNDPTWRGLTRGMPVLAALWWAWSAYAWLTNTINPEEGVVRLAMFASMGAMLVAALAVPNAFGSDALAFGSDALAFGVAYLVVRVLHLALYELAARGPDPRSGCARRPRAGRALGARAPDRLRRGDPRRHGRLAGRDVALRRALRPRRVPVANARQSEPRPAGGRGRVRRADPARDRGLRDRGARRVAAICVLLIAYEAIRFRAVRHEIRHAP